MKIKSKVISLCIMTVLFAFAVSGSWAITCTYVPNGCGTPDAVLAVASNFDGPAHDLVAAFQVTGQPGAGTCVEICQDATATLLTAINNNPGVYDIFFAANATAPVSLQNGTGNTAFSYARGVPVLYAPYDQSAMPDVGHLIVDLGETTSYTISANTSTTPAIGSYTLNITDATYLALADPSLAPYGKAGFVILNDMGELTYPPVPSPLPTTWMYSTLFGNIDDTLTNINAGTGGIKAGFVSKAQICEQIYPYEDGTAVYVQFTNSTYTLDQKAILLDSSDSANPPTTTAGKLRKYILDKITADTWYSGFLVPHCYNNIQ